MDFNTKILIVEDEIIIADFIQATLNKEGFKNVEMAHKTITAIEAFKNFQPEIIILDINLHGENSGIELAKSTNKNATVIFLTGQYDESLMSKALATNPESYLTKPIKKYDLLAAIKLSILREQVKSITIKDGYDFIKINHDAILFVKSDNNYIDIQTTSKKHSVRQSLEGFLEEIANPNFIRVHRSYIVNSSKIQKKTNSSLFIENQEIPFSKMYDFPF
ncbi:LytR/AlgR family response regulator transcription factor [Flavobacterium helocola]|uniref:Response regulator transcription factor n=1 Tax=Flavobacterium helocola TaxID=3139139 RepID=A0ABU9I400_9FLAO